MTDLVAAVTTNQGNFRIRNLPVRSVNTLQLSRSFNDLQHAFDVSFRKLTS